MDKKMLSQKISRFFLMGVLAIVAGGCGVVHHTVDFHKDYTPNAETKIEVAKSTNATGEKFDIDIEGMMTNALVDAFRGEELLWTGNEKVKLTTTCKVLEYKKGDAFKRWLWPGWGATVLEIHCDLTDSNNMVGTVDARRSVTAGGGYTIGAWEKIFTHVAEDVAADLRDRINGQPNQQVSKVK